MGKVIIFSAPSGAGKTTIVRELLQHFPQFEFSVSATSRAPRGTERDGVDYHFLTPEAFAEAVAQDRFVEWEEVYKGTCYGTLRSEVERIWAKGHVIVFDVDVMGGLNLKRIFGADACSIFIMPPSIEELRRRLVGRATDAPEVIERRVAKAEFELTKAPGFDHVVVNDVLEDAVRETTRIVEQFIARRHERDHALLRVVQPDSPGHIALAEYAVEQELCDELVLVVSPQNPSKEADELAPELDRFEMAEMACAPSNTPTGSSPRSSNSCCRAPPIRSTRCATWREPRREMSFSILMGGDLVAQLDRWKEYETILDYPLSSTRAAARRSAASATASRCSTTRRCRTSPRPTCASALENGRGCLADAPARSGGVHPPQGALDSREPSAAPHRASRRTGQRRAAHRTRQAPLPPCQSGAMRSTTSTAHSKLTPRTARRASMSRWCRKFSHSVTKTFTIPDNR